MKNYPACRVKTFSIISSGGHIVQQSGTVCAMLLEGIIENFCILLNLGQLKYRSTSLSSIPEHFPYIALYFKPVYVELGYQEIWAISKWFFIPENRFSTSLPLLVSK